MKLIYNLHTQIERKLVFYSCITHCYWDETGSCAQILHLLYGWGNPQLGEHLMKVMQPVITSNGVPYLQTTLVASYNTLGEKRKWPFLLVNGRDWCYSQGKHPLARNLDRNWGHCDTNIKFLGRSQVWTGNFCVSMSFVKVLS